jgi:hypothetical protein
MRLLILDFLLTAKIKNSKIMDPLNLLKVRLFTTLRVQKPSMLSKMEVIKVPFL